MCHFQTPTKHTRVSFVSRVNLASLALIKNRKMSKELQRGRERERETERKRDFLSHDTCTTFRQTDRQENLKRVFTALPHVDWPPMTKDDKKKEINIEKQT